MASEDLSPLQWHYTFELPLEFLVSAPVPTPAHQMDYLHHSQCNSTEVAKLHGEGKTLKEICQTLGASKNVTRKVIEALGLELNRRAHVSYLRHPGCNAQEVLHLRAEGHTFYQIGRKLGVSKPLV